MATIPRFAFAAITKDSTTITVLVFVAIDAIVADIDLAGSDIMTDEQMTSGDGRIFRADTFAVFVALEADEWSAWDQRFCDSNEPYKDAISTLVELAAAYREERARREAAEARCRKLNRALDGICGD